MIMADHRWTARAPCLVGSQQHGRIKLEAPRPVGSDIGGGNGPLDAARLPEEQPAHLLFRGRRRMCEDLIEHSP